MKRFLISLFVLVIVASGTARAELINSSGPVALAATVDTTTNPTYNIVTVTVASIVDGADVVAIHGQWTAIGTDTTGFYLPGDTTRWQGKTTSINPGTSTFINLATTMGTMDHGTLANRTPVSGAVYHSFANLWYQVTGGGVTTDPDTHNGNVLAVLFVTKDCSTITFGPSATEPSWVGIFGHDHTDPESSTIPGSGSNPIATSGNNSTISESFTIHVPEPSTFWLLASGVMAIAFYLRRRGHA